MADDSSVPWAHHVRTSGCGRLRFSFSLKSQRINASSDSFQMSNPDYIEVWRDRAAFPRVEISWQGNAAELPADNRLVWQVLYNDSGSRVDRCKKCPATHMLGFRLSHPPNKVVAWGTPVEDDCLTPINEDVVGPVADLDYFPAMEYGQIPAADEDLASLHKMFLLCNSHFHSQRLFKVRVSMVDGATNTVIASVDSAPMKVVSKFLKAVKKSTAFVQTSLRSTSSRTKAPRKSRSSRTKKSKKSSSPSSAAVMPLPRPDGSGTYLPGSPTLDDVVAAAQAVSPEQLSSSRRAKSRRGGFLSSKARPPKRTASEAHEAPQGVPTDADGLPDAKRQKVGPMRGKRSGFVLPELDTSVDGDSPRAGVYDGPISAAADDDSDDGDGSEDAGLTRPPSRSTLLTPQTASPSDFSGGAAGGAGEAAFSDLVVFDLAAAELAKREGRAVAGTPMSLRSGRSAQSGNDVSGASAAAVAVAAMAAANAQTQRPQMTNMEKKLAILRLFRELDFASKVNVFEALVETPEARAWPAMKQCIFNNGLQYELMQSEAPLQKAYQNVLEILRKTPKGHRPPLPMCESVLATLFDGAEAELARSGL